MELFLPHQQAPSGSMTLVARTSLDPRVLIEPAKAAVWEIDPLQTFYQTATLDELVGRTLATRRFALIVLTGFSLLALLLAAAGLYGVLSSIASQYRREIGVRLALGARWADIVRLLLARGFAVAAAGVAMGLVAAAGGGTAAARLPVQRRADRSHGARWRSRPDAARRRDRLLPARTAGGGGRSGRSAQGGMTLGLRFT